ncbi:MAG TPA: MlaD family protein [Isosphaeraceae bacterium]|jgi:phospholipid/cholesterol/gamma-HCH transport system substrate-binding protein|nr:MlaD family protein [Isosphaeraceae bacterium]
MSRAFGREVWVGLVLVLALAGFAGLLVLAGGGPGYLTSRRHIDVVFKDAQGIRVGSPVRVAGLDAGRVSAVELIEVEGALQARLRLAVPEDLASKLRQDAKVTVQASLTGQACVNIVAAGRSKVALMPGQLVRGIETSMFDPILDQVGLGPVERNHISHSIAEVRQTVDSAGPRLRQILAALQSTAGDFREAADAARPAIVSTARRIDEAAPKVEATLKKLDRLLADADGLVAENRPGVRATLEEVRRLSASVRDIAEKDRKRVEDLLDALKANSARIDRVLYQAEVLGGQGNDLLARNRAVIDRTFLNVRDATDYGDKLVQKLFANPFVLSPFYKPTPEDIHAQTTYDTAHTFLKAAQELNDSVKNLQALRNKPTLTAAERQKMDALIQRAAGFTNQIEATSRLLADDLRAEPAPPRRARRNGP